MGSSVRRPPALTQVVVRPASIDDVADVAALERHCYADPWPAAAFTSLPENPSVYFAVARVQGLLKGYVVGWHVLNEAELANLAVESRSRRSGLGSMLLDGMLGDADGRGTERIFLEVRESNEAARRLYASRGFREIGRRKKYYRTPDEDALVLKRERTDT